MESDAVTAQIDAADIFYGPMRWSDKVGRLRTLVDEQPSERTREYLAPMASV